MSSSLAVTPEVGDTLLVGAAKYRVAAVDTRYASNLVQSAQNLVERFGQDITFNKLSAASTYSETTGKLTATETDYTVRAVVRGYRPQQITGLVQAGDKEVILCIDDSMVVLQVTAV